MAAAAAAAPSLSGMVPTLHPKFVYGRKDDVPDSVHFLADHVALYTAGHYLVKYNMETKSQYFVEAPTESDIKYSKEVTSIALSADRKYLAVAVRAGSGKDFGNARAILHIFEAGSARKKREIRIAGSGTSSSVVLSLAFSSDSRRLMAVFGAPEYAVVCWDVEGSDIKSSAFFLTGVGQFQESITEVAAASLTSTARRNPAASVVLTLEEERSLNLKVSFCPNNSSQVVITGLRTVQFLSIDQNPDEYEMTLKPIHTNMRGRIQDPSAHRERMLTHVWVENKVIVSTTTGLLLLFEPRGFLTELACSPAKEAQFSETVAPGQGQQQSSSKKQKPYRERKAATCLVATNFGLVAGLADGTLRLFRKGMTASEEELVSQVVLLPHMHAVSLQGKGAATGDISSSSSPGSESKANFSRVRGLASTRALAMDSGYDERSDSGAEDVIAVTGLAVNLRQDTLLVALSNRQLLMVTGLLEEETLLQLVTPEALASGSRDERKQKVQELEDLLRQNVKLEPLVAVFPSQKITGLATCVRKPLVVVCSEDHWVRVYNYMTKELELAQRFPEMPLCVDMHPSGLYIAVGFRDKLQVLTLLMDSMRKREALKVKACREVRFSNGGHLLAAANHQAKNISIYDWNSLQLIREIPTLGVIASIYWETDDTSIVLAGSDGGVHQEWVMQKRSRITDWSDKSCKYRSAVVTADQKVYAVGTEGQSGTMGKLIEISDHEEQEKWQIDAAVSQMVLSSAPTRMLFISTESGFVRSYRFQITGEKKDTVAHAGAITRMCLSFDDQYLFTAGEDGALVCFEVKDVVSFSRLGNMALGHRELSEQVPFSQEVLVTRADLDSKNTEIQELAQAVEELRMHNAYQLRINDIQYQDALKETTEKFNLELEQYRSNYDALQDDKTDLKIEYEEKIKLMTEDHRRRLESMESEQNKQITDQVSLYNRHHIELEHGITEHVQDMERRRTRHRREMKNKQKEYEALLAEKEEEVKRCLEGLEKKQKERDVTQQQMLEDADKEIEELKKKYKNRLRLERDETLRLQAENGIMKKNFSTVQKKIDTLEDEKKALDEAERQAQAHVEKLTEDLARNRERIQEKDAGIGKRETEIYDLKKRNQELEKNKFVLDFEIKELKREIEPRDAKILRMKAEVHDIDKELEDFHTHNRALEAEVKQLNEKLKEKQSEIQRKRTSYRKMESQLDLFKMQVQEVVQHVLDPDILRAKAVELFEQYAPNPIAVTDVNPDVKEEYERQRQYLERSVAELKRRLTTDAHSRRSENIRLMQENIALIKEINDLRKEISHIRQEFKAKKDLVMSRLSAQQGTVRAIEPHPPGTATSKGTSRIGWHENANHRGSTADGLAPVDFRRRADIIAALREEIEVAQMRAAQSERPQSSQRQTTALPPI